MYVPKIFGFKVCFVPINETGSPNHIAALQIRDQNDGNNQSNDRHDLFGEKMHNRK